MNKRIVSTLAVAFCTLTCAMAQVSFQSYDPVGDSAVVAKMRYKMDRIRRHRPTVAVVLSGGGAKGSAHVGALKYIEEIGIPVDMVLGTSMGGLIGGLYSIGYSPAFLDSLLRSVDWNLIMSDKIPPEYISYSEKKYKEKYILSIPFFYSNSSFMKRSDKEDSNVDATLHLGANDELSEASLKKNIFGSLPSGYIYGHNVNNVFSGLTVGYQDDIDFTELPIPFFCVAGEIVSGKAYLWHEGKLNTALRSTMSIPGIFAPVRTDGMILVDGGVRNNFPTDIAREMGADIVIGVELSDDDKTYDDLNNLADVAWQFVDILGRDTFEKNVKLTDVTIKPDLHGFNMLSFDPESVSTIIGRGYEAAVAVGDQLKALKDRIGPETLEFQNPPAVDIGELPIVLSSIQFEGVKLTEYQYLANMLDIKARDKVYKSDIEDAVAKIYATKSFDYVNYELLKDEENFILNIKCKKGPVHQIGLGARFDSESLASALLNIGFNVNRVEGSSWDITAKIGSCPYLDAHYVFKFPGAPTVNLESVNGYTNVNLYSIGTAPRLNLKYWKLSQKLYLSGINWKRHDIKFGLRNDFFNVTELLSDYLIPEEYDISSPRSDYLSLFLKCRSDSFDDGYFPESGFNGGISYDYVLGGILEEIPQVHILQMDASKVFRLGEKSAFIPSVYSRCAFGDSMPLGMMNVAGGTMAGRYMEQQVPFMGVSYATPLSNKMLMLRADLRFHLTQNNYLTLVANALKDSNNFDTDLFLTGDTLIGCGVEYAYDTILGPVKANLNWSNLKGLGFYLGLGFDF